MNFRNFRKELLDEEVEADGECAILTSDVMSVLDRIESELGEIVTLMERVSSIQDLHLLEDAFTQLVDLKDALY